MPSPVAAPVDPAQAFVGAEWFDVMPRSVACPQLPPSVLLHAGPPFRGLPPAPVVNAALQALLFERLAEDEAHARELLSAGRVQLRPAQDYGVATPLAQVVSGSMWLVAVRHTSHVGFGAMLEGAPPALRFGSRDPACRERMTRLGRCVTDKVVPRLRAAPVALAGIIREAVAAGDDCHSRTSVVNQLLMRRLEGSAGVALDADTAAALIALTALSAFVLPILMAAAIAALRHHGCAIEALGGNGMDFGLRRHGAEQWERQAALPPRGETFPGGEGCSALPAIGDSVLVDFCGLGGQVDDIALRDALRDPSTGILDPVRIARSQTSAAPKFNLAMLDAAGVAGLIGRGTYRPPTELFHAAR